VRLISFVLLFFAGFATAPAWAAGDGGMPAPVIAPAPDWVEALSIPTPNPALKDKPVQPLLLATQSRYLKDGTREYSIEAATLIQTPQGLSAVGNVIIPWQPQMIDLIVHKVRILRDGRVIDLLKNGQQFTVLRRENNLEGATLDGVLTAAMQPEGLSVGDVLDVAWTYRFKPQAIAFRAENVLALVHGFQVRHLRYRELWENGLPIRWAATEAMGKPKVTKSAWGTELVLDRIDIEGPETAPRAPARFLLPARLEVTGYADWADISKLMAPLYETARELAPDSPLKAEIERIAALGTDPKKRAMAALRMIQDKVRYFALAIGDGGYVPAKADLTWSRKFGDCKGKTVLLLALLKGLGIDAEPVLVNSGGGDLLSERLPGVQAFNHVIVRARIEGRPYWLDGTRSGDRDLESLASSPFSWGLPVRIAGATLEKLPLLPPSEPLADASIVYDASKGFEAAVPVSGRIVFRGHLAESYRLTISQNGTSGLKEQIAAWIPGPTDSDDVQQIDAKVDEDAGTTTIGFSGKVRMDWKRSPGADAVRFQFQDETIKWNPDFTRPEKFKDIPFALEFPAYLSATETIILPRGGQGFTLDGQDFVRDVGGAHIERHLSVADGRAVARSRFRILQSELPAKEGAAAATVLTQVNADRAYVRSPIGYRATAVERTAILASQPVKAEDYVDRGYELLRALRPMEAMTDFDKAIALSPQWSRPLASKAVLLIGMRKLEEAQALLDKAAALSDDDSITWQGYGLLRLQGGKPAEAIEAFNRSIALDPDYDATYYNRMEAYEQLGRLDEAAADLAHIVQKSPDDIWAYAAIARLAARRGREQEAIAAAERFAAPQAGEAAIGAYRLKALLLSRFGHGPEAAQAWAKAIALIDADLARADEDRRRTLSRLRIDILIESGQVEQAIASANVVLHRFPNDALSLSERCWARASHNQALEQALADCQAARRLQPLNSGIAEKIAFVKLRLGKNDEAIADYDAAMGPSRDSATSLFGRGIALLRKGDKAGGERDISAARLIDFDIDQQFKNLGVTP
jgi:tetratricopeptide (TPR) repeat protein